MHSTLLAAAGQAYVDDLRRQLAPASATLKAQLAQAVADVGVTDARHASGTHAAGHDETFTRYAELVTSKADLAARIATLEAGLAKGLGTQASLVAAAIKAAGGADAVATGIKEGWLLTGHHDGADTDPTAAADIRAKAAAVAALDDQFARLGGSAAVGKLAQSVATDRAAAATALDKARAASGGRIMAAIKGLVAGAASGDEPSRAAIGAVTRANPRAFVDGFADSLRAAQWEWSPLGPTALAMIDASGLPLTA